LKNARERMDILAAYREVGGYRGAAVICGTTHKTVRRVIEAHEAGGRVPERKGRGRNYDDVRGPVAERVRKSQGRISAKRLLPAARAAGYVERPEFRAHPVLCEQLSRVACCCGEGSGVWLDMGRRVVALPGSGPRIFDPPGPQGLLAALREGPMSSHTALASCGLLVVAGLGFGWGPAPEPVHQPLGVVPVHPGAGGLLQVGQGADRAGTER
jgi:hypothetical protein